MIDPKPDLSPYFTLLGTFSHYWAAMEYGMDSMLAAIYHRIDLNKAIDKKLPWAFAQKVTYLRKAATNLPALAGHQAVLNDLLNNAELLAEDRHLFTHGIPLDYDTPNEITHMYKINFQKGTFLIEETTRAVKWSELRTMANDATTLALASITLAEKIIQPLKDAAQ
jgi:hypothetical protein